MKNIPSWWFAASGAEHVIQQKESAEPSCETPNGGHRVSWDFWKAYTLCPDCMVMRKVNCNFNTKQEEGSNEKDED